VVVLKESDVHVARVSTQHRQEHYAGPGCEHEAPNEGEENAAQSLPFAARGSLDVSRRVVPGHTGGREAEILVLAARGYEKKLRARCVEVLADTSLCKSLSVARGYTHVPNRGAAQALPKNQTQAKLPTCMLGAAHGPNLAIRRRPLAMAFG